MNPLRAVRPVEALDPRGPRTWRARRGAGIAGLKAVPVDGAAPGPDEVRVRVLAVSLNQRDLMLLDGRAGPEGRDLTPCSDAVGEVLAVGSAVRGLRPGDRVVSVFFPDWIDGEPDAGRTARALGGTLGGVLADEVVLPAAAWLPVPRDLDLATAASLSCAGVTAWHALQVRDPLPPGASVVLLGTGGVSLWALQLAKALQLRVALVSSEPAKLARAEALGADLLIDRRREPDWARVVQQAWGGADRVLDVVGPATLAQSIEALRYGGSVAVIGRLSGHAPAAIDPAALFLGQKRLQGLMVGSRAMTAELAAFVHARGLRPVVERVFARGAVVEAFAALRDARHVGKLVIALDAALAAG